MAFHNPQIEGLDYWGIELSGSVYESLGGQAAMQLQGQLADYFSRLYRLNKETVANIGSAQSVVTVESISVSGSTLSITRTDGTVVEIDLSSLSADGTNASPYTMLPSDFTTVAAQTDTWSRSSPPAGTDGVIYKGPRTVWDNSTPTAPKWYEYYRSVTFDSRGNVAAISAETRREIITPTDCTAS